MKKIFDYLPFAREFYIRKIGLEIYIQALESNALAMVTLT